IFFCALTFAETATRRAIIKVLISIRFSRGIKPRVVAQRRGEVIQNSLSMDCVYRHTVALRYPEVPCLQGSKKAETKLRLSSSYGLKKGYYDSTDLPLGFN